MSTSQIRTRQAALLLRPMLRGALSWRPLAGAAALALGLHVLARALGEHEPLGGLRQAWLLLGLGAAFAFDDAASPTIEPTPAPLPYRRGMRAACMLTGVAACASVMIALASSSDDGPVAPIRGRLVLELTAMVAVAWFGAAAGARLSTDRRGGLGGAGTLIFVCVGAVMLPSRWAIFVRPDDPRWTDAGRDIGFAAIIAVLGAIALSLDPARQRIRARHKHRPAVTAAAPGRLT